MSNSCLEITPLFSKSVSRCEIDLGEFELRLIARQLSLGLSHRRLKRSGIDLHQRIADMNMLPLLVFYFRDLSRTRAVSETVLSGVTVPSAWTYTPMSPLVAVAVLIITGGGPLLLPVLICAVFQWR